VAAPRYETILVGVDFSDASRRALDHAAALARGLDATLEVVHVVPRMKPSVPFSQANRRRVAELQRAAVADARQKLDAWVKRLRNVKARARVVRGLPHEALLAQAKRAKADLVVVGERGQNLAESLLLGSTAERVARKARRPVLLIPVRGRG
jgi:nucleotide-binding universal stress UspA family protein